MMMCTVLGFSVGRIARASLLAACAVALVGARTMAQTGGSLKYPPTPRDNQTDDLHGVRVADPYRWLEHVTSPDVQKWVSAENAVTTQFLASVQARDTVQSLVQRASAYTELSAPIAAAERLFFTSRGDWQNQPALYVQDRPLTPPRVLIDPNAYSPEGLIAIVDQAPSPDGRYLAYTVSVQGGAWRTVHVRDVRTGQDLPDELQGIRNTRLAWTQDSRGFFYVRDDEGRGADTARTLLPPGRERVYYHRVGRPQASDAVVYENSEHPAWRYRADLSEDGQYLVIAARNGVAPGNRLYFIDLDNPRRPNLTAPIVRLFDADDARYEFVGSLGAVFFIRTTKDAPRGRLAAVDINMPDENHWTTVVRQTYDPLVQAWRVDNRIVAHRYHDAHSVLELYALDGTPKGNIPLPGIGTVTDLQTHAANRELWFTYTSFLQPPTVFRFDLDTKTVAPFHDPPADSTFSQYETTQTFYASADGTRVPMFVTARRGMKLDGGHPTLLAVNGGFGSAFTPVYSPDVAAWIQLGGVYAVANVRGGGEYGRAWHEAAMGAHRQTAIDDFTSAAEFLVSQHYTRPALLAITGRGNGALLAGAAMMERPELFGAALLDAGLLDMARYNLFGDGSLWSAEYGSPDNAAAVPALLAYSPLQHVRRGAHYPPTLLTVGDHDGVFTPAHEYKFAAALQNAVGSSPPVLLAVQSDAGHGTDIAASKERDADAERITFLLAALHYIP